MVVVSVASTTGVVVELCVGSTSSADSKRLRSGRSVGEALPEGSLAAFQLLPDIVAMLSKRFYVLQGRSRIYMKSL